MSDHSRPVRLGGPVFVKIDDPTELARAQLFEHLGTVEEYDAAKRHV